MSDLKVLLCPPSSASVEEQYFIGEALRQLENCEQEIRRLTNDRKRLRQRMLRASEALAEP